MNKEEAKNLIKILLANMCSECRYFGELPICAEKCDFAQAVDMAIKALFNANQNVQHVETPTVSEKHQLSEETPTNTPTDLINRQDAIDALGEEPPVWYDGEDEIAERNQWRRDKAAIVSLPSADRPTGKWVKATGMMPPEFNGHHCCSVCGGFAGMEPPYGNREDFSKYCPNCGVKMRGEEE